MIEDDFGLEHIDIVATHRRLMKTIIYTRDCAEEDRLRTDRIYRSLYPRQDGVPSEDHAEDEVSKSFDAHGWNYILQIKETTRRSYSYRSIHPLHLLLLGALAFLQRQRPSGRETAETAETAETLHVGGPPRILWALLCCSLGGAVRQGRTFGRAKKGGSLRAEQVYI